jgi:hypothetical protein
MPRIPLILGTLLCNLALAVGGQALQVECPAANATSYKLPKPVASNIGWLPSQTTMGFGGSGWFTSGAGLQFLDVNGDDLLDLVVSISWWHAEGESQYMSCVYLNTQKGWQLVE